MANTTSLDHSHHLGDAVSSKLELASSSKAPVISKEKLKIPIQYYSLPPTLRTSESLHEVQIDEGVSNSHKMLEYEVPEEPKNLMMLD